MASYINKNAKAEELKPNKATHDSKLKRIVAEQKCYDIDLSLDETASGLTFENTITGLYGIPGIGKTRLAYELGKKLQEKHGLERSGLHVIRCEPVNHSLSMRGTDVPTWPTFRAFVDAVEADPEFVSTVKLWCIDTIDSLIPKGISTVCHDLGIINMKDGTKSVGNDNWVAEAWQELRAELMFQILRLHHMGPGVLILGHERYRKGTMGRMTINRPSMDLSDSVYNALNVVCSMMFRLRGLDTEQTTLKRAQKRALCAIGSKDEDAKDNLDVVLKHYADGVIPFTTEKEAVERLYACFGDAPIEETPEVLKKVTKKVLRKSKKEIG